MDSEHKIKRKRGQRGPGKREALTHVSIRIPINTKNFYNRFSRPTYAMRRVLEEFAKENSSPVDNVN